MLVPRLNVEVTNMLKFSGTWRHMDLVLGDVSEKDTSRYSPSKETASENDHEQFSVSFHHEDWGDIFLRNAGSNKNYKPPQP
jgi:hypothetical protein